MILVINPDVGWVKRQAGVMKILTVVVNIFAISLLVEYALTPWTSYTSAYFIPVTTGGFLLVDIFLIVSYTMDDGYGKTPIQELTVAGLGAVFSLAAGAIVVNAAASRYYVYKAAGFIYGFLCFINTVFYSLTIYFHVREREALQPAATTTTIQQIPA